MYLARNAVAVRGICDRSCLFLRPSIRTAKRIVSFSRHSFLAPEFLTKFRWGSRSPSTGTLIVVKKIAIFDQ